MLSKRDVRTFIEMTRFQTICSYLLISAVLVGCGPVVSRQIISKASMQISEGMSRNEVRSILGEPQRSNKLGVLSYDGYCNNPYWYEFVDIIYDEREQVVDISFYERGGSGDRLTGSSCTDNFRAIPLSNFERVRRRVAQERAREVAERERAAQELAAAQREAELVKQDYFIDGLVIIHTQDIGSECVSGGDFTIQVRGEVGPDSSFALEELLRRSPNCLGENREIKSRTTVELESLGGYLNDGYLMGRTFRTHGVKTIISNDSACASSCAVAYLGGVERLMEDNAIIMFHSPYLPDLNALGERVANCEVGGETVNLP